MIKRLAHFTTGALSLAFMATFCAPLKAAPARPAQNDENDQFESPAQFWNENLPSSKRLNRALAPQSLPAFGAAHGGNATTVNNPAWRAIGPTALNGQTSNRVDPVSGRATTMAIHPTNPSIVYAGTAQGGLWRSLNGGASWTQLMDNAMSSTAGTPLAIGSVVISPASPSTVFVGTGEGNLSGDSFFGSGFYIITNADSFNPIVNGPYNARSSDGADIFTGRSIVAIAVDPTNSNNVFVSTSSGIGGIRAVAYSVLPERGVYRSTNALAGVNGTGTPVWTRLQVTGTTLANTISTSLVMDPADPNTIIAAFYGQAAGDPAGIYRTTTALAATPTWTLSKTNALAINTKLAITRVGGNVTVYATTGEANGSLYKSTDGGVTFGSAIAAVTGFAGGQSFYDIAVGVDPTNPNNVSVGGNTGNNIYRYSRDGGATFPSSVTGLHADVHWIAYAPSDPSVIYHLNDGGIWKSVDAGLNWSSLNNGTLNTFQYSGIAVHPTDRNFTLAGTQDNGTHMIRPDGSGFRVDFGDGGFSLIDQNATDTTMVTMYHTYFNQTNNLIGTGRNLTVPCAVESQWAFRGVFAGVADPTPVCDGSPGEILNGIVLADAVNFYAPMVLGPGNPNSWYFGTDKLYRSPNRADTAVAASQTLQSGVPVSSIAVSPQDDNVRLVGLNNGKVFATVTGIPSLLQIAGVGATNGTVGTPATAVGRITIDPNNKNVAYLAFGGFGTAGSPIAHVWKTTNLNVLSGTPAGNVVFTPMSTGLPDLPANAFAIDPQSGSGTSNSTDLYVGTDQGVYGSQDGGISWSIYGTGFPRVAVFGLEIQNQSRIIRAATHGRGMYETFVNSQPGTPLLSQVVSRKTHGAAGTFDINMPRVGPTGVEDRVGNPVGSHTIVFTFTTAVTGGTATSSSGSVSSVTFSGNEMTVNLAGVTDPGIVTVTVNNVTSATGSLPSASVNVGFLAGDVNADRVVNSGDAISARSFAGTLIDTTNFRNDVNADGVINAGDATIIRSKAGNTVMADPAPAK
ncbi:MAG: dockerin type I domain-containing protein [Chthoniobacterales bacterium]